MQRLLLVVDPQIDFISGSLAVPGAEAAMNALAESLSKAGHAYAAKVATCDRHPYDHCSFVEEGGPWPRHCVADTEGAAIWPGLVRPLFETAGPCRVLHKGEAREREEYSIFQNPASRKEILDLAAALDATGVDICGIAGDVCVLATLQDGVELLGAERFRVLAPFTPSLDGGEALKAYAAKAGIVLEEVMPGM